MRITDCEELHDMERHAERYISLQLSLDSMACLAERANTRRWATLMSGWMDGLTLAVSWSLYFNISPTVPRWWVWGSYALLSALYAAGGVLITVREVRNRKALKTKYPQLFD